MRGYVKFDSHTCTTSYQMSPLALRPLAARTPVVSVASSALYRVQQSRGCCHAVAFRAHPAGPRQTTASPFAVPATPSISAVCSAAHGFRRPWTWPGSGWLQLAVRVGQAARKYGTVTQAAEAEAEAEAGVDETKARQPRYSPLHFNIEDVCRRVVPTEDETRIKYEVIEGVKVCVRRAFDKARRVEAQVFGSFANGTSAWNSDVDIVVTGLCSPDRYTGVYDQHERRVVSKNLDRIAMQLHKYKRLEVTNLVVIRGARIPIIKMRTRSNVTVDISLSDDSGVRAARYVTQQIRAYPSLRPLVLVLKTFLKHQRLNEVASGGLSSYSLANMVLAHLQEELKAGRDICDLGETLYGFLCRFGDEFDYSREAVSVACGGVVAKSSLRLVGESRSSMDDDVLPLDQRLCVDDPLTGRDVSSGTYRMASVRIAFERAARRLEGLAAGRTISDTTINYLTALFDPAKVVKRMYSDAYDEYFMLGRGAAFGQDDDFVRDGDVDYVEYNDDEDELHVSPTSTRTSRQQRAQL